MKCADCGYHWQEEGEEYPRCHFEGPEGWAPCEAEDEKGKEPKLDEND